MSKKTNPALIGAFILGAFAILAVAVIAFGSASFFRQKEKFTLFFNDSVNGLNVGASVKYKGVVIGSVSNVLIRVEGQPTSSSALPVIIELDMSMLTEKGIGPDSENSFKRQIKNGLYASMQYESMVTGMLYIELNYAKKTSQLFDEKCTKELEYTQIPTMSAGLSEIKEDVINILSNLNDVDFVQIGQNILDITNDTKYALKAVDFRGLNDAALSTMKSVQDISNDPNLRKSFVNLNKTLEKAQQTLDDIDTKTLEDISKTLDSVKVLVKQYSKVGDNLSNITDPDSQMQYNLDKALSEFASAARSVRLLTDYLERNPQALLTGKPAKNSDKND